MKSTVLILGANSDIAIALAHVLANEGYALQLASRDIAMLNDIKSDIEIRYHTKVDLFAFDALHYDEHKSFYNSLPIKPDIVVCAFGYLGNHHLAQTNSDEAFKIIHSNYTGAVSILDIIAHDFEQRKQGIIVGISSVAGDRGRASNYYYGSAKSAFTAYLSGLRNRLFSSNVHVMTVKPGFVRTKMLGEMPTPAPLTATSQQVALAIFHGIKHKKNEIYTLGVWRYIMLIICHIPEFIFKKMKL